VNGAHDMGGMHGFGPIDPEPEAEEPVFHAEWERRAFALTLAAGALGRWTLDASRHARERQHPVGYLRHSYYENWLAGLETLLIETGLATREELRRGRAETPVDAARLRVLRAADVPRVMARGGPVAVDMERPPRFAPGERVRVRNRHPAGHTRAPRYVRGRLGTVQTHHGGHVFADRNAHGVKEGEHLYSVRFAARELWGEDAPAHDAVCVDLWEPHLEPTSE